MKKLLIIVGLICIALFAFTQVVASEDFDLLDDDDTQTSEVKPIVWQANCAGCGDCVKLCPADAIVIKNSKAYIDADKCIDCKQCISICTFKAIR